MVSKNVKVGRLFGYSESFEVDRSDSFVKIIAYVGDKEYHVAPNDATIARLKAIRAQFKAILDAEVLINGTILELWEKQMVEEPGRTVEKYVRIQ